MVNNCECVNWAQAGGLPRWSHHETCPKLDKDKDAEAILRRLCAGIEAWAADEDGVHPECWQAYRDAKAMLMEFVEDREDGD